MLKGTPRGIEKYKEGMWEEKRFFCYSCSLSKIQDEIKSLKKLEKDIKLKGKKVKKKLIIMGLKINEQNTNYN